MKETLYNKLMNLGESDEYPFHMPGHKRNMSETPFKECSNLDITEIEGFDNLHHPQGIIEEEQRFITDLYQTRNSFYLVGGSTSGVLTAICAAANEKDKIIMARNSHKSAYNAAYLKDLSTEYIMPQLPEKWGYPLGMILPQELEEKLKSTQAKVVFVTSPSYEGIISDIRKIAEVVHKYNGVLIVDEAHGAHLGFHKKFPESALSCNADIVIQSLHKTMPSLTMTALLHICSDRVSIEKIKFYMSLFQTSSPSYLLMASMSYCSHLIKEQGNPLFECYFRRLEKFYNATMELENMHILDKNWAFEEYKAPVDPSKIIICVDQLLDENEQEFNGNSLAQLLLSKYHIQIEMASEKYVIAMTSIMDTDEGFDRLKAALYEIDKMLHSTSICNDIRKNDEISGQLNLNKIMSIEAQDRLPNIVLSIKQAIDGAKEKVKWKDCINKISAEYIYLYPPGAPIIVPGEVISQEVWDKIEHYKNENMNIQGTSDYTMTYIEVCKS